MRYLWHKCTECQTVNRIESALVFVCPVCAAPAGNPCIDQVRPRYRELTSSHQARRDLVDGRTLTRAAS